MERLDNLPMIVLPRGCNIYFEEDLKHIRIGFPYDESFIYSFGFTDIQDRMWLPYFREWQIGASHYEEVIDLFWQFFSPECRGIKVLDPLPERPQWLTELLGRKS